MLFTNLNIICSDSKVTRKVGVNGVQYPFECKYIFGIWPPCIVRIYTILIVKCILNGYVTECKRLSITYYIFICK